MKIKTIRWKLDHAEDFDAELNQALADGYQLVRRDIVPGFRLDGGSFLHNMLYAELVLPDPLPAPAAIDPFEALHAIKAACLNHKGPCNDCPITDWCAQLCKGGDPTDWELPEVDT